MMDWVRGDFGLGRIIFWIVAEEATFYFYVVVADHKTYYGLLGFQVSRIFWASVSEALMLTTRPLNQFRFFLFTPTLRRSTPKLSAQLCSTLILYPHFLSVERVVVYDQQYGSVFISLSTLPLSWNNLRR